MSHNISTSNTTGFYKGTDNTSLPAALEHLKASAAEIMHPILFPIIVFTQEALLNHELSQRGAREWLRRLEHAISFREGIDEREAYVHDGHVNLDVVNKDLGECQAQALWNSSTALLRILTSMKKTMESFHERIPEDKRSESLLNFHERMLARLDLYEMKFQALDTYAKTTAKRLEVQRGSVSILSFYSISWN
jgi:hypothetical protein